MNGPYPLTVMNWGEINPTLVRLNELVFTQEDVQISKLISIFQNWNPFNLDDPYPHVVSYDDKMYLEDGHHRVTVAIIKGQQAMAARVFKFGSNYEI